MTTETTYDTERSLTSKNLALALCCLVQEARVPDITIYYRTLLYLTVPLSPAVPIFGQGLPLMFEY